MIKLYTVDECETCAETIKWLEEKGVPYEIIDLSNY